MTTKTVQVVSEADLLKSIQELETNASGQKVEETVLPTVEKVDLKKSTVETVTENASAATKRALDVSDVLTDILGLVGKHNDEALSTLQKSVNAGAERDLAIVKVLVDLKKSVDALADQVAEYGKEPRKPRSVNTNEVLHKSVNETGGGGQQQIRLDPRTAKRQITQGLEVLAKSMKPEDPKYMEIQQVAIRFEATGVIDDRYIAAATKALNSPVS